LKIRSKRRFRFGVDRFSSLLTSTFVSIQASRNFWWSQTYNCFKSSLFLLYIHECFSKKIFCGTYLWRDDPYRNELLYTTGAQKKPPNSKN